jgi:hypothetical protein
MFESMWLSLALAFGLIAFTIFLFIGNWPLAILLIINLACIQVHFIATFDYLNW